MNANIPTDTTEIAAQPPLQPVAHDIGAVLIAESVASSVRPIELAGNSYTTDLPAGLDVFEEPPDTYGLTPKNATLRPKVLDDIPVGEFSVTGSYEDTDDNFQKVMQPVTRPIAAYETPKGKVITRESFGQSSDPGDTWALQPGTAELMTDLGYVVDSLDGNPTITAVPTPDTVQRSAAALGVDIKFFPNEGIIPGRDYLQAFADGKYPVSTGSASYYKHDIGDDHLTALAIGGEPLKSALISAATAALEKDDAAVDAAANYVDKMTAILRTVVAPHTRIADEHFGTEKGRASFHDKAADLGISPEVADEIIATAQENGRKYNMHVQPLD
jgi:hypothetical protein